MISKAGAFQTIGTATGMAREALRRVERDGVAVFTDMPENIRSTGDGRRDLLGVIEDTIRHARDVCGVELYAVIAVHEAPGLRDRWYASLRRVE